MCIEFLTCWCFSSQNSHCCIFFDNQKSIRYIQLLDWIEFTLTIVGIYLYFTFSEQWLIPILFTSVGHLLPSSIRIVGSLLWWIGCCKLTSLKQFYKTRFLANFFQICLICAQMALTVLIFNNKISFLASGADWAVDDNYDRLSYGLCVFCRPSECQTEFDEYLLHKSDLQKQKEDLNLSSVLKWPNLTNFTSVNEYAHAGVSKH